MSTAGSPVADSRAASDIAARLCEASFARLVAAGTGDGVAAAALLADALERQGVAHQISVVSLPDTAARNTEADVTVALGRPVAAAEDVRVRAHASRNEYGLSNVGVDVGHLLASRREGTRRALSVDEEVSLLAVYGVCFLLSDVVTDVVYETRLDAA
jgi:hypothetical protein